jgi:hypothetical protein
MKPSHVLGAALVLANAALLWPLASHTTPQSTGNMSNEATIRVSENTTMRFKSRSSGNVQVQQQQAVNQNNSGSLQNGTPQPPQHAEAGEEVRKVLKKNFDKYCGQPGQVC